MLAISRHLFWGLVLIEQAVCKRMEIGEEFRRVAEAFRVCRRDVSACCRGISDECFVTPQQHCVFVFSNIYGSAAHLACFARYMG